MIMTEAPQWVGRLRTDGGNWMPAARLELRLLQDNRPVPGFDLACLQHVQAYIEWRPDAPLNAETIKQLIDKSEYEALCSDMAAIDETSENQKEKSL